MGIKQYLIIGAMLTAITFVMRACDAQAEAKRYEANQENLTKLINGIKDDMAQLEFDDEELKKFVKDQNQNTQSILFGVEDKLANHGVKLNRIDRLIATSINTSDTSYNRIVLDSLKNILAKLSNVNVDSSGVAIPFEDKTECFKFKAQIVFESGEVAVEVLERQYNDTLYNVSHWERRQWKFLGLIKTRIFGKKVANVTVFNNCGYQKTIIVDNKKPRGKP